MPTSNTQAKRGRPDSTKTQGGKLIMSAKERDGVKEINKVCKAVLKLKESDFDEAFTMAQGQQEYTHPFKMATARKQGELGDYNLRVLNALDNLRSVLIGGENVGGN